MQDGLLVKELISSNAMIIFIQKEILQKDQMELGHLEKEPMLFVEMTI